jgi:hypothetical protein
LFWRIAVINIVGWWIPLIVAINHATQLLCFTKVMN